MDLQKNANRFSGKEFVNTYDQVRPTPPIEIIHQSLNYLNKSEASNLLDIGCGTGISTLAWQGFANQIIGVDPSADMIELATKKTYDPKRVKFINGFSHDIPISSYSIDLVTCSQSFHWMEPESTLNEIHRVLIPSGVLVIYDVIWPPSVNEEFEMNYNNLFLKIKQISNQFKEPMAHFWEKEKHLVNVQNSNLFKFVREGYYHKTEAFNRAKLAGITFSQGGLEALLKRGMTKEEIGLTAFEENLERMNNPDYPGITYNYRVIFAKK